jgi:hypothetical protein
MRSLGIVRSRRDGSTRYHDKRVIVARPVHGSGAAGHACRGATAVDMALEAEATNGSERPGLAACLKLIQA